MNNEDLSKLVRLTDDSSRPNINALMARLREVEPLALTIKYFGYELARALADALPERKNLKPQIVELKSKPSTQTDIESDWVAYWCQQLKVPVVFHRKIWELAYVLQAIYNHGSFTEGKRGLGFGCGEEPLPSLLAASGVYVTVTDLSPEQSEKFGWAKTAQHTKSVHHVYKEHLVSLPLFESNVHLEYVDMNAIPSELRDYDFCWSICSLEHLGSIQKGLEFIENSLKTVRSGGLAVHTTEFNFSNETTTLDNWDTVLFQRRHFYELANKLRMSGHTVAELDFNIGNKPLDKFIDIPPWSHDMTDYMKSNWGEDSMHIKLSVDGIPSTCFGMIITKK